IPCSTFLDPGRRWCMCIRAPRSSAASIGRGPRSLRRRGPFRRAPCGAPPPQATIVCNGAGNFSIWVHRFWRYRRYGTQLAPISGSMGYGVPAAIAAKRLMPERTVLAFAGDGDFLMTGQELATAMQYELPVIIVVVDNGMYGTIRMHQERHYPARVIGTELRNPDFAALARAYGGFGATVENTADFTAAFQAAVASGKPAVIHLKVDPQAITPATTLDAIRKTAQAA